MRFELPDCLFSARMEIIEQYEKINLFEGLENLSIIHISDIHLWSSISVLNKLEAIITAQDPDLIILTGDYYDQPTSAYTAHSYQRILDEVSIFLHIVEEGDKNNIEVDSRQIGRLETNFPLALVVAKSSAIIFCP